MLRNYLKIALRNILKRRVYSLINIAGLSVGIAASIIIFLYLEDELSYDRFHEKSENLYRVAWFSDDPQTRTPHPLAQALVKDFAEVESAVSLSPLWGPGLTKRVFTIKRPEDDIWYEERDILAVDSTFFDVFSFELTAGNPQTVLRQVGGVLLSESAVAKYFGEEEALGKFIMVNDDSTLLQVEGIFADVPGNSHFHFDALISYVTQKAFSNPESEYYTWADFGHFNYIRLTDKSDPEVLESKLMSWAAGYLDLDEQTLERLAITNRRFELQPVVDIHLKSAIRWELEQNGNIGYVYIMSAAAIFILIIASFNFMNLTTARSIERAGEIGVRKAMGADRRSLYGQFIGESILMSLMSLTIAGFIVEISLPAFNAFTNKELQLEVTDPSTLSVLFILAIGIGLLSGLYPAAFLSALRPVEILKGKYSNTDDGKVIRKIFVILQFGISMFLIAGFSVINKQLNYLNNKDLGFDKESVIIIPIKTDETRERFEALQSAVSNINGVVSISAASNVPGTDFNQNPIWADVDPDHIVNVQQVMVDHEIFKSLGLELLRGRSFIPGNESDVFNNFVINEGAEKALNLDDAVGTELTFDMDGTMVKGEVIGVIKDFHFQSLHQPIRPLVFQLIPAYNHALIRVEMDDFANTISSVETTWNEFDANFDFEFDFLDEMLGQQYAKEQKMGAVFGSFAILAILIACLGLAAIAAIDFANRKKEIGIRKVLGAPFRDLTFSLLKDYTIIVLVALVFALPLWWITMGNWLNNFNFRIPLNPLQFIISGILLILISWATLGYLTYSTISADPIKALQDE